MMNRRTTVLNMLTYRLDLEKYKSLIINPFKRMEENTDDLEWVLAIRSHSVYF